MKRQLIIVLIFVLFVPCVIYGEDHDGYVIYDGSSITYNDKTAYVYLDEDISLTSSLTIRNGYTLYLCLHGHSLSIDSSNPVITNNGTLILSDCTSSGAITSSKYYGVSNYGTFDFYGGFISNNGNSGVYNKSIFNMYGGVISNNKASYGAGVTNNKTFNMYGGVIKDNTASLKGGGVCNESGSTFNMYNDSLITNNIVNNNGGAGVYCNNKSSFTMSDSSSISNNIANCISGGGLYVYNSTITIKDNASIVGNHANVNGSGIYFDSGSLYVNNNVSIDDVYLPSDKTITVLDELGDKASIGISVKYPYTLPVVVLNSSNTNAFYYINDDYSLESIDNTIKLKEAISFPTYIIDIPSSINFDEELEVKASIDEGSSLVVKVADDNDFTLVNEDNVSLAYLIKQGESILNNNDIVLEVNGNSGCTSIGFELTNNIKYSGTYTGTVMFTVFIDDK